MPLYGHRSLGPTRQPHGGKEDEDVVPSIAFSIAAPFSLLSVLSVSVSLPSARCRRFPLPGPRLCFTVGHTAGAMGGSRGMHLYYVEYPIFWRQTNTYYTYMYSYCKSCKVSPLVHLEAHDVTEN
jgi:hypothetical protein